MNDVELLESQARFFRRSAIVWGSLALILGGLVIYLFFVTPVAVAAMVGLCFFAPLTYLTWSEYRNYCGKKRELAAQTDREKEGEDDDD